MSEDHGGEDFGRSFLPSFLSREGLLLLRLWACGQRAKVVQAQRHGHSRRVERAHWLTVEWLPNTPTK
jgi:hypothetical protein